MKAFGRFVLVLIVIAFPFQTFAQDQYQQESTPTESANLEVVRVSTSTTYQLFNKQFATWAPGSLHWNAPSNLLINSDGSWFLYARYVANMRRDCGIPGFDCGHYRTALVNITYYDGPLQNGKCTGAILHSMDHILIGLNYKDDEWDVTNRGTDPQVAAVANRIACGSFTRRWR